MMKILLVKNKYKGIVLLLMLFVAKAGLAQETDSIRYMGLRIGADFGETFFTSIDDNKLGVMLQFDYEFKDDKFAALELGWHSFERTNADTLRYSSLGQYGLVGMDFNFLDKGYRTHEDITYLGVRYGMSYMYQEIEDLEELTTTKETVTAHWGELIAGAKVELWFLRNVFMGLSFRLKILATMNGYETTYPDIIPGFGTASNRANLDVNWTIAYRIPFKHFKVKERKEEDEE